jgi:hypothetical protein
VSIAAVGESSDGHGNSGDSMNYPRFDGQAIVIFPNGVAGGIMLIREGA